MSSDELRVTRFPDVDEFLRTHDLDPLLRAPLAELLEGRAIGIGQRDDTVSLSPDSDHARLAWTSHVALGGMGEIHRVYDKSLHRLLILKVLRERFMQDPAMHAVFLKEAQFTAQLAHPSIPPVHEIGRLDDGRPYFTMKEVRGRTLSAILKHEHALSNVSGVGGSEPGPTSRPDSDVASTAPTPITQGLFPSEPTIDDREPIGEWSEHRLMEVFQKICEAVAYAHSRGVVHCDLKPDNVMVGRFGEVVVMDWGVALHSAPEMNATQGEPIETRGFDEDAARMIGGTPGYMAPEQMAAAIDSVGPFTDVYALGVILFEIFAGRRPYRGKRSRLFRLAMDGKIPPLPEREETIADEAIYDLVVRAMRPNPGDRIGGGAEFASEISLWREGALKREKALSSVRNAESMLPGIAALRSRAIGHRSQAAALSAEVELADRTEIWKTEDRADELERQAALLTAEATHVLRDALVQAPGLLEARRLLADIHFEEHRTAIDRRDWAEAARHELLLKAHDVGEYADYLAGSEVLRVAFSRPCRVRLYRFRERHRREVPEIIRAFASTTSLEFQLPVGTYVLMLRPESGPIVHYPFVIERRRPWDPAAELDHPVVIPIPHEPELHSDDVVIPAGRYRDGGEWRSLDDLIFKRRPITAKEYAAFLQSGAGRRWRSEHLRAGVNLWRPNWPAVGMSFEAAEAFARWYSETSGQQWRLPTETEWVKAATGVDGRTYPWGDRADHSFCHCRSDDNVPGFPAAVSDYEADSSPYGVLGMGANVRDWCVSDGGEPAVRGGSFRLPLDAAKIARRATLERGVGHSDVGFRLARDYSSSS